MDLYSLLKHRISGFTQQVQSFSLSNLVNALWRCPSIVPTIYTNSFVSQKIMEGAGLMVPGIVVPVICSSLFLFLEGGTTTITS